MCRPLVKKQEFFYEAGFLVEPVGMDFIIRKFDKYPPQTAIYYYVCGVGEAVCVEITSSIDGLARCFIANLVLSQ
jgi:hypothetical protein